MQKGFSPVLILVGVLMIGLLSVGGYYFYNQQKLKAITDFESCAKYFLVLLSYPGQCNTSDGRHFVQELSEEEKKKLIPPQESSPSGIYGDSSTYRSLKEALKEPQKVYSLDLSEQGLNQFPREVLKFTNLRSLFLNFNKITDLPMEDMSKNLPNLELIDMTGNPNLEGEQAEDFREEKEKFLPKVSIIHLQPMSLPK